MMNLKCFADDTRVSVTGEENRFKRGKLQMKLRYSFQLCSKYVFNTFTFLSSINIL